MSGYKEKDPMEGANKETPELKSPAPEEPEELRPATSAPEATQRPRGCLRSLWSLVKLVIVGGALAFIFFYFFVFINYEAEQTVVTRFGKPVRVVIEPGLHLMFPFGVESLHRYDKRLQEYDIPVREIITKDKKTLVIDNYVEWKITDPLVFLQTVQSVKRAIPRIDDVVYSAVRNVLGKNDFVQIIRERKNEIIDDVTHIARSQTLQFGVDVIDVRIQRADLPEENREFVFRRMQAERQKQANRYRSEGEKEARTIRSQADLEEKIQLAEAYKTAQMNIAQGEAEAARIYAEAYNQDPEFYRFLRRLEALEKVVDSYTTIVLSDDLELLDSLKGGAMPGPGGIEPDQQRTP